MSTNGDNVGCAMKEPREIKGTGRPPGRPRKFEKRHHATVRIAPERYADLRATADAARRSVSEEVEHRIERLAALDGALAAMRTDVAQIAKNNFEAELWRRGYTPVRQPGHDMKLWAEPGFPSIQRSGFEAWAPGELEADLAQAATIRQAAGISDADVERGNAEKLRRADEEAEPKTDEDAA
jgi:hypothetical protein